MKIRFGKIFSVKYFLIIFCLCCVFVLSNACTKDTSKYNLDFRNSSWKHFKWKCFSIDSMYIDENESVNGKHPLCVISRGMPQTVFCQQWIFPSGKKDSDAVSVSINNKCNNWGEVVLKLYCLDRAGKVVYTDSVDINNDSCWVEKTIRFSVSDAKHLILGVYGIRKTAEIKEQKLWLDRINVLINGKNIEDFNIKPLASRINIDENSIVPLVINDAKSFEKIMIPAGKRIIGLGESLHGSKTFSQIHLQTIKYLITQKNCRLILLESGQYEPLLWDLYVQGKMKDEFLTEFKEDAILGFFGDDLCNFLAWLREYNSTTESKVKIRGLMDDFYSRNNELFDYLYAFSDQDIISDIAPILRLIGNLSMEKALDAVQQLPALKETMGDENYATFTDALNRAKTGFNIRSDNRALFHKLFGRDYVMAQNADRAISGYLWENETAVIVAHAGHINRKGSYLLFPYIYSMGYYLNEKYGNAYYPIGIYAGTGSIRTETWGNIFVKYNLKTPVPGSIEAACYRIKDSCFFYSATDLPDVDIYYRQIGSGVMGDEDLYEYEAPADRIDGFIFVKESHNKQIPDETISGIRIERMLKKMTRCSEILNR